MTVQKKKLGKYKKSCRYGHVRRRSFKGRWPKTFYKTNFLLRLKSPKYFVFDSLEFNYVCNCQCNKIDLVKSNMFAKYFC